MRCRALPDEALEHCPSWHQDLERDLLLGHVDSMELNRLTAGAPVSGIAALLRVALRFAPLRFAPHRLIHLPGRTADSSWGEVVH